MKNLILKFSFILFTFCLNSLRLLSQTTDFSMSLIDNDPLLPCSNYAGWTFTVYDNTNAILYTGGGFTGRTCLSPGTPSYINITDGTYNFNLYINNSNWQGCGGTGSTCGGTCFPSSPPASHGFFLAYYTVGGVCANPSGLLTLTVAPYQYP